MRRLLSHRHASGFAPLIRLFLVVQMPDARHVRRVSVLLGPIDRFLLGFARVRGMISMIFDDIILNRAASGRPLGRGSM
jgi:hypothetical protein